MDNISALKNLYTSLGGSLTDSYDDIADGAKVSEYSQIADGICACSKKTGAVISGTMFFKTYHTGRLEMTYDELVEAVNNGAYCLRLIRSDTTLIYPLMNFYITSIDDNSPCVNVLSFDARNGSLKYAHIIDIHEDYIEFRIRGVSI